MELKKDKYTVGVIVGRFQCDSLHDAHKALINTVIKEHPKVLIFLGLSPTAATLNNPLPFAPRKQMIYEAFSHKENPNLTVCYIKDVRSNEEWSKKLDETIKDQIGVNDTVVLYGSRDSFLPYYKGKYATRELASDRHISGTEIRKRISEAPQADPLFRAGAIWASFQRYPTTFTTVDIAVYDQKEKRVLLARKPNEDSYRFVGGFSNPNTESFELDALRELNEETGLTVGLNALKYIGSAPIDDWRYRREVDKIKTLFYIGYYTHGCPRANDDISEVRWFPIKDLKEENFMEEHRPLFKMFADYVQKELVK
jgi:bifunctional NMN adenylyltransferase/nudix hydrolase